MSRAGRTVLLIDHPVGKRDDRASRMLAERGYALDWRCPGRGDPLPAADDAEPCAVIVYGGPESANDDTPYLKQEMDWIEPRYYREYGSVRCPQTALA